MLENGLKIKINNNFSLEKSRLIFVSIKMSQPTESKQESNELKRINAQYLIHEFMHLFHLESGYLYTIKELFLRPGKVVQEFLYTNRKKYVKPIIYLIFNALIFTILIKFAGIGDSVKIIDNNNPNAANILKNWMSSHIAYTLFIMIFFWSISTKIFYWKSKYNFFELIILKTYVVGQILLLLLFIIFFHHFLIGSNMIAVGITQTILFSFLVGSLVDFFGHKKIINYVKVILSIILGLFLFFITIFILLQILGTFKG